MGEPMTRQCRQCVASDITGDRHMVSAVQRWTLTDPAGVETVLCSPCCVVFWAAYALPVDVEATKPQGEAA
jgi:hypothetical protein